MRKVKCTWLPKSKKWRVSDLKTGERVQFEDEVMLLNATRKQAKGIVVSGLLIEEPSCHTFDLMDAFNHTKNVSTNSFELTGAAALSLSGKVYTLYIKSFYTIQGIKKFCDSSSINEYYPDPGMGTILPDYLSLTHYDEPDSSIVTY